MVRPYGVTCRPRFIRPRGTCSITTTEGMDGLGGGGSHNSTAPSRYVTPVAQTKPLPAPPRLTADHTEQLSFLDKYERGPRLGNGGQASVFLAVERASGKEYVARRVEEHGEGYERVMTEIRALRNLQHPHIAGLHELFSRELSDWPGIHEIVMVMTKGPGKTIAQHLADGRRFTEIELTTVKTQLWGALQMAHAKGIIHRDIKPSNVLLDGFGEALHATLIDFGIAKNKESTTTRTTLGKYSLVYAAPEQILGERTSAATDIHGLGLLLMTMAQGKPRTKSVLVSSPLNALARLRQAKRLSAGVLHDLGRN